MIAVSPVTGAGSVSLARPKSSTFTSPVSVTMMLAGFRSRWTMPAAWAAPSASAICTAYFSTSARGSPSRSIDSARVLPATYSMAMKSTPSAWPMSWIVTMFGWLSAEAAFASCTKRRLRSGSATFSAGRTLMATKRSRWVSRAL